MRAISTAEIWATREAIVTAQGDMHQAAEILGVGLWTIYARIHRHGLYDLAPQLARKRQAHGKDAIAQPAPPEPPPVEPPEPPLGPTTVRVAPSPEERRVLQALVDDRVIGWRGSRTQLRMQRFAWIETARRPVGVVLVITRRGQRALGGTSW